MALLIDQPRVSPVGLTADQQYWKLVRFSMDASQRRILIGLDLYPSKEASRVAQMPMSSFTCQAFDSDFEALAAEVMADDGPSLGAAAYGYVRRQAVEEARLLDSVRAADHERHAAAQQAYETFARRHGRVSFLQFADALDG
jgi:hypothetical protein